jgi:hypothetical protein
VGVKAEGKTAELSLPVPSPEATEDPTNSYSAATAARTGSRGGAEKADPRVLPSAGVRDAIPGMTRRSHVVPEQRMLRGCER